MNAEPFYVMCGIHRVSVVTHADYRALEEEVIELRKSVGQDTDTITRLEEELAALRVRVGALVDASTYARRELQSCQVVIRLYGGVDLACVQGAQKAMSDLSDALEDLK